jgi:uncharacterized membrane protein
VPSATFSTVNDPAASSVAENVKAISTLHERAERSVTRHQRAVEVVTRAAGRPLALYVVAALALAWSVLNGLLAHAHRPTPDPPPFFWLQGVLGLLTVLLTITILATQQRQARLAEMRAHLDLQVNLLAEQKVAKVVQLLEELRRDLPSVPSRSDPQAAAMAKPADPHAVADALTGSLPGHEPDR